MREERRRRGMTEAGSPRHPIPSSRPIPLCHARGCCAEPTQVMPTQVNVRLGRPDWNRIGAQLNCCFELASVPTPMTPTCGHIEAFGCSRCSLSSRHERGSPEHSLACHGRSTTVTLAFRTLTRCGQKATVPVAAHDKLGKGGG